MISLLDVVHFGCAITRVVLVVRVWCFYIVILDRRFSVEVLKCPV